MAKQAGDNSEAYAKGFNQMAFIAKHDPALAKALMTMKGKGERFQGMKAGQRHAQQQAMISEQKAISEKAKTKQKTK